MRVKDLPFFRRQQRSRAGLYISSTAVAVATAVGDGERHLRCRGVRLDGDTSPALAAREIGQELGVTGAECVLVVAPHNYQVMLVERPDVAAEEVKDAVRWQIQEYLDFPAEQAVIDVFGFPESAARGRAPMVFVVAMARAPLIKALHYATDAGFSPTSIDVAELALRNLAWSVYPSPEHAVGLLRLTASTGLINITRGDELFLSRRISGVPAGLDSGSWEAFKDGLLLQVQRSIDYYESALSQPPANGLLVATTHGHASNVVSHLEEMLPLPVRRLSEVLTAELDIELLDPEPVMLSPEGISEEQDQALAAVLPAIGGFLRRRIELEQAA